MRIGLSAQAQAVAAANPESRSRARSPPPGSETRYAPTIVSAIPASAAPRGQLGGEDRGEDEPEQRRRRQQRAAARRADPRLAEVERRPADEEVDQAGEREGGQPPGRHVGELADVLGRHRGDREDQRRDQQLQEGRGVDALEIAHRARVERLKESEAGPESGRPCGSAHAFAAGSAGAAVAVPPKKRSVISGLESSASARSAISTRPLSMTTPSVAIRSPKRTFCSIISSVLPASIIRVIAPATTLSAFGSRPDRRLVEHHQRRVEHQRARELDRPALAAGEVARLLVGALGDQREQLGDLGEAAPTSARSPRTM